MTPFQEDSSPFMMLLTLKNHQIAEQFRQQQSNPKKAKQVYLNTLAVQAVNAYLSWLGVDTDIEASDSWNPAMQALTDVADLVVKQRGQLECRPVLPEQQICHIPPDVWSDRLGYVAVQFDPGLSEATLLGFVPSVTTQELPLCELRSLDQLINHLNHAAPTATQPLINLRKWLNGVVDAGWQTLDGVLGPQPTFSFRSVDQSELHSTNTSITRGKLFDLRSQPNSEQVALLVELAPTNKPDLDIWVKVCPTGVHPHLPPELELMVLDDMGVAVMQAQSRNTEMIQLKFSGVPGEHFSIKIVLDDISFTEDFVI